MKQHANGIAVLFPACGQKPEISWTIHPTSIGVETGHLHAGPAYPETDRHISDRDVQQACQMSDTLTVELEPQQTFSTG